MYTTADPEYERKKSREEIFKVINTAVYSKQKVVKVSEIQFQNIIYGQKGTSYVNHRAKLAGASMVGMDEQMWHSHPWI